MFTTRYQDLDTLIVRDKSHKTEAGRAKWVAKQVDAGAIKVLAYGQGGKLASQGNTTNEERVVETRTASPKVVSTRILDATKPHAWVVGCETATCANRMLVAKYDYRPVSFANINGPTIKTIYTAPGRRDCGIHMLG